MTILRLTTTIHAPIERCFDLARSIDLHRESAGASQEEAIAGVTRGLIGANEEVTWRARHLGFAFTLTSRITAFERPGYFRDEMVRGPFAHMRHDHRFETRDGHTEMSDVFDFAAPLGALGALVDTLYLGRYMLRFLATRNAVIRRVAESERWRGFLET